MKHTIFSLFLALFFFSVLLWGYGFLLFQQQISQPPAEPEVLTDAIVVLTGGSARLEEGFKLLKENKAKKLFISGVGKDTKLSELLQEFGISLAGFPHLEDRVGLGYIAENTKGNADETALWMKINNFHSLRLVTASYHMPRSLLELRRVMKDVKIVPHPVFSDNVKVGEWYNYPGTRKLIFTEYHKYLAALIRTISW